MKKQGFLSYLSFCFYLLVSLPVHADIQDKNIIFSIKVSPNTPTLTLIYKKGAKINDLFLLGPKGEAYSVAKKNDGILATAKNEVMQIKNPTPGLWLLSGPKSQIEQAQVLNNVGLNTNLTDGMYFNSEFISLSGFLEHDYQAITTDLAIEDMKMKLDLINNKNQISYVIPYSKKGIFTNQFVLQAPPGKYRANWRLEDRYISLENRYIIMIHDAPFNLKGSPTHDTLFIKLLDSKSIKPESVKIKIFNNNSPANLNISKYEQTWVVNFFPLCRENSYKDNAFSKDNVLIEISANEASGRELLFKLLIRDEICSNHFTPLDMSTLDPKAKEHATLKAAQEKAKKHAFLSRTVVILLIALLVIALLLLGIWYWNKKSEVREEL